MIWIFLACFTSKPSNLDQRFCEARCAAAGAADCVQLGANLTRYNPVPSAQTTVDNGDILCTCCFPNGVVQPSQDALVQECE
jgi:hypothetical protein